MTKQAPNEPAVKRTRRRHAAFAAVVLAAFWLLFSGKFDVVHLSYGVVSVALVLWLTRDLFVAHHRAEDNEFTQRLHWGRALVYPLWLFKEIVLANFAVARLILHPKMPIDPVMIRFRTRLEGAVARVTLGNSITLTPGTFTVELDGQDLVVHAITRESASSLVLGSMQKKVAWVFGEKEYDTPDVLVSRDLKEAGLHGRALTYLTVLTVVLAVALLLPFLRVLQGPTVYDRMIGVGVIGTKTVILICLVGMIYDRLDMFVDIAVAYAMLNFISAIVVAKYLERTGESPR